MAHTGERAVGGRTSGLIGPGETVTWEARHLGRTWNLTSRIVVYEPPTQFVDEQVAGPFRSFRHEHRFEPAGAGTVMIDDWVHEAPFGPHVRRWTASFSTDTFAGCWRRATRSCGGSPMGPGGSLEVGVCEE